MIKMIWIIYVLLHTSQLFAQPTLIVIYDSGHTESIERYLPKPSNDLPNTPKPSLPYVLPITTKSMQLGDVQLTKRSLPHLNQPLFLIGADKRSRLWLRDNYQRLLAINAVGLLIEVDSHEEVKQMSKLAKGLRITPASAESFAADIGLTHYPVLLSRKGWEQ